MKTSDAISVPGLRRDAGDPVINGYLSYLVVKYAAPIRLEDEPDENGDCVIVAVHGDPAVVAALIEEVNSREETE